MITMSGGIMDMKYNLVLTLKICKALLIEYPNNFNKVIHHLQERVFYKMPEMKKYILSEESDQSWDGKVECTCLDNLNNDQC